MSTQTSDFLDVEEEWRPVVRYEGWYEVSSWGRVRRVKDGRGARTGRIRRFQLGEQGYPVTTLHRNRQAKRVKIHALVCEAFHGARPAGLQVRHLDGDPLNSHYSNLAWGTGRENMLDAVRHGVHPSSRKTECKHGHPFSEENTLRYTHADGSERRRCRECKRAERLRNGTSRPAEAQQ